jgi:hypothetical protein
MKYLTLALVMGVAGCGSNATSEDLGADLAVPDMTAVPPDMTAAPRDMTPVVYDLSGPFMCGNMTCNGGTKCCVVGTGGGATATCTNNCQDGGLSVECRGPQHCGGNPCCATIMGMSASNIRCTTAPTQCPPDFNLQTQSGDTRLCNYDADCTNGAPSTTYKDCCTGTMQGQTQRFCFDKSFAAFVPGLTCP